MKRRNYFLTVLFLVLIGPFFFIYSFNIEKDNIGTQPETFLQEVDDVPDTSHDSILLTPENLPKSGCLVTLPPLRWVNSYRSEDYSGSPNSIDRVFEVYSTPDCGYILFGEGYVVGNPNPPYDQKKYSWIVKINARGNLQWQKNYTGGTSFNANSWDLYSRAGGLTSDNGYFVSGFEKEPSRSFLIRLNSSGDIIWRSIIPESTPDIKIVSAKQVSDGGFLLVGHTGNFPNMGIVYKINSEGVIQWTRRHISSHDFINRRYNDFIEIPEGYLLLSNDFNNFNDPLSMSMIVTKLDFEGNLIQENLLQGRPIYGFGRDAVGYTLESTPDGNFLVGGADILPDNYLVALVVKVNLNNLSVAWERWHDFGTLAPLYAPIVHSLKATGRSYVGVAFVRGPEPNFAYPILFKMNQTGHLEWKQLTFLTQLAHNPTIQSDRYGKRIVPTIDGGYIFAISDFDYRVFKTNATGSYN